MKKIEQVNKKKILTNKERELNIKKMKRKQIKLMELNSKENIKTYWN